MMNIRFVVIVFALLLIIVTSEYIAYASFHSAGIIKSQYFGITLMILGVILPMIFISTLFYSYKHYSLLFSWLNTITAVWLIFVLYVFMASLIVFILLILNYYFKLNISIKMISYLLIFIVILITVVGIRNSNIPKVINYHIKSESLSKDWAGKNIIIISDIHIGNYRKENFLKNIISLINKEKPDIVFILGDLIEGTSFPYEKWFKQFNYLNPPLGNQYVEGNHEKYNQEYGLFKSQFPKNINDLTDKNEIINNTQIIGLSFREQESDDQTISRLKELDYNDKLPSIILIHNPQNTEALASIDTSLILSGHTHGGQFFPFTTLVNWIYKKYTHGIAYTNKTVSITSSGVGTAIVPFRIGTTPEIIVLNIE